MMLINAIYLFSVVNIIVSRDVQRAKYKDTISVSNSNTDCRGFNSIWGMDNTCTCGNFKAYTFMSAFPNGPPRCVYDYMGKLKKVVVCTLNVFIVCTGLKGIYRRH